MTEDQLDAIRDAVSFMDGERYLVTPERQREVVEILEWLILEEVAVLSIKEKYTKLLEERI